MELLTITLTFDSPEEQKFYEDNLNWYVMYHETFENENEGPSFTEFDISATYPEDIPNYIQEVRRNYEKISD